MDFQFIISHLTTVKIRKTIIKYSKNNIVVQLLNKLLVWKQIEKFALLNDEELLLNGFAIADYEQQIEDIVYRLIKKDIIDSKPKQLFSTTK